MERVRFTEKDKDRLFQAADFGMRRSHKDELQRRLFSNVELSGDNDEFSEDELSEDAVLEAAGGNKRPDDHGGQFCFGQERKKK